MDRLATQELMMRCNYDTVITLSVLSPCTSELITSYFWYQWVVARTGITLPYSSVGDWRRCAQYIDAGALETNRPVLYSSGMRVHQQVEKDLITIAAFLGIPRDYMMFESMSVPLTTKTVVHGMWVSETVNLNCDLAALVYNSGFTDMRELFASSAVGLGDQEGLTTCVRVMDFTPIELYAMAIDEHASILSLKLIVNMMSRSQASYILTEVLLGKIPADIDVLRHLLYVGKVYPQEHLGDAIMYTDSNVVALFVIHPRVYVNYKNVLCAISHNPSVLGILLSSPRLSLSDRQRYVLGM